MAELWRPPNPGSVAAREQDCACEGCSVGGPFIVRSSCPLHSFAGTVESGGRGWTAAAAWKPGEVQSKVKADPQVIETDGVRTTVVETREFLVPSSWLEPAPA